MVKIYGPQRSSASRCRWAAEEAGVAYENVEVDMKGGEHKTEAFLKLNPNSYVPVMEDGTFVLWESFAINQYLAEKYAPALSGSTPEESGLIAQWSFWNTANVVPPLMTILHSLHRAGDEKPNEAAVKSAQENLLKFIGILNVSLAGKDYLVNGKFTLADLNVMSSVSLLAFFKMSLEAFPNVSRWAKSLSERPAFQKVFASMK